MLKQIRTTPGDVDKKQQIIYFVSCVVAGLLMGIYAKFAGVISQGDGLENFIWLTGNLLSSFVPWIFLGVIISIYSKKSTLAAINLFAFCCAMLLSYYAYSVIIVDYLAPKVVVGWSVVALLCAPIGFLVWYARNDVRKRHGRVKTFGLLISAAPIAFLVATLVPTYRIYRVEGMFVGIPAAIALVFLLQKGKKERLIVSAISLIVGILFGVIPTIEFVFGRIL